MSDRVIGPPPPSNISVIGFLDVDGYECQLYQREKPWTRNQPCIVVNSSGRLVSVSPEAKALGITRTATPNFRDVKKKFPDLRDILQVFWKTNEYGKPDTKKTRHGTWELLDAVKQFCKRKAGNDIVIELASSDEIYLELSAAVTHGIQLRKSCSNSYRYVQIDSCTVLEGLHSGHGPFLYNLQRQRSQHWVRHAARDEERLVFGALFMRALALDLQAVVGFYTSSGVATNRFAAKVACGLNKPGKTTILNQYGIRRIAKNIKVSDIPGLGGKLGNQLTEDLGAVTLSDLRKFPLERLEKVEGIGEMASMVFSWARGKDSTPVIEKEMKNSLRCNKPSQPVVSTMSRLNASIRNLCDECKCFLSEEKIRHKRIISSIKLEFAFKSEAQQSVSFDISNYNDLDIILPAQILRTIIDAGDLGVEGKKFVLETLGIVMKDFIPCIETAIPIETLQQNLAVLSLSQSQSRVQELRVQSNLVTDTPKFSHKYVSSFGTSSNQGYYWNETLSVPRVVSSDRYADLIRSDLGEDYLKASLISDHQEFYELKHKQFQLWLQDYDFIEKVQKGKLDKPEFICFNGRITDTMQTPDLRQFGDWEIYAINVAGIIFLWDEKPPKPKLSLVDYFGIGFEYLVRCDNKVSSIAANESEHVYAINSTTFGQHKLLVINEIDGIDADGNWVELRSMNERLGLARISKLRKLWTTNVIAGVNKTIIGIRSETGILLDVTDKTTEELEKELGTRPEKCLQFQDRLMSWMKSHLPCGNRNVVMKYSWVCGSTKVHSEQIQKKQVPQLALPRLYAEYFDSLEKEL